ncbi:discoidin domain-containing protein [Neiella marina]|uniref:Discoidin domain-containing protein n=1 Tax=Neiella holothuriorum TaxID=2870530 RepID=A0ABS7EGL6_9GAMM|nr:LamG-like jellyroll fold domain-containing protein [Neiella holothuriorum]MBW8191496.1 discoidin domain-containing protein [Neiella holothuriorum]
MNSKKSIFHLNSVLTVLVSAGLLSACGGSGGGSNSSSNTFTVTAIDGYLANAEVYSGVTYTNGCAVNEYLGMTNDSGELPEVDQDYLDAPLCVKAIAGTTTDLTRGDVTSTFEITAPAGYTVVTPITHLVMQAIQSDDEIGLAEAEEMVLAHFDDLGVTEDVLFGDYLAAGTEVAEAVEIVAEQLADFNDEDLDVQLEIAESLADSTAVYIADETLTLDDFEAAVEVDENGNVTARGNFAPELDSGAVPAAEELGFGSSITSVDLNTLFSDADGDSLDFMLTFTDFTEAEAGLMVDSTGVLMGTPTAIGSFSVDVVATDGFAYSDPATLEYTVTEATSGANCTALALSAIDAIYDEGSSQEASGNGPAQAIDDDTTTRWSSPGDRWLVLDLGEARDVALVETFWYKSDERYTPHDIEYSLDGETWTTLAMDVQLPILPDDGEDWQTTWAGDGATPIDGRYLRLTAHGYVKADASTGVWNSLNEVRVSDCGATGTAAPEIDFTNKAAALSDLVTDDIAEIRYDLASGATTGMYSARILYPADETQSVFISVYDSANSTSSAIADLIMDEGNLQVRESGGDKVDLTATFTPGEWVEFGISWDTVANDANGNYTVYIDGVAVGSFTNTAADTEATHVSVKYPSTSNVTVYKLFVDNFAVYSDAAGTMPVFEDDFENNNVGDSLVADPYSDTGYDAVVVEIDATNGMPVLDSDPAAQAVTLGDAIVDVDLTTYFVDPEGDTLSYGINVYLGDSISTDSGLTISGDMLTGTPTEEGDYTVTIAAFDGSKLSTAADFVFNVTASTDPDPDPDPTPGEPADANYAWDFSVVDDETVLGDIDLSMSKSDNNPRTVVEGATADGLAVNIEQSTDSGTYGYYYAEMGTAATDPLAFNDGVMTMEIVFKADDIMSYADSQDLQLLENTDSNKGYKLIVSKSSQLPQFKLYNSSGSTSVTATTAIESGEWYHIVATFNGNGSDANIYVNGVLEGTATISDYVPNDKDGDKVYVGGGSNSSQKNLDGALDHAGFWTSVLTADEVAARATTFGFGETSGPADADYAWGFSIVGDETVLGDIDLSMSKSDNNPRTVVEGATADGLAVNIEQSTDSGTYGYYYAEMGTAATDPLAFNDGVMTMEIVFKADDIMSYADSQDLQLLENTDSNKGYKLIVSKSSQLPQFKLYNSSGSTSVTATTAIVSGQWYHIVATFSGNGSDANIYVNGALEGTATISDYVPNDKDGDKVYVGGGSNSSQKNLDGALDHAGFWASVLTDDEVAARAETFGF